MLRRVVSVSAVAGLLLTGAVTTASASGSTTLTLDAGNSVLPRQLAVAGASAAGVLVREGGYRSRSFGDVVGRQHLLSGGTSTLMPDTFNADTSKGDLIGSYATALDERGATPFVTFDNLTNGDTGQVALPPDGRFLSGGPAGWVELNAKTGLVDYVTPTSTGLNATVTRSTLTTVAGDYLDTVTGAANSTGVLLSNTCTGTVCSAASRLQFLPFNGSPAQVLSDPAAAWSTSDPVTSQFHVNLNKVRCPSTSLCVGLDFSGNITVSNDADQPSPTWGALVLSPSSPIAQLSCPSATLCVALNGNGQLYTSTNPTPNLVDWSSAIDLTSMGVMGLSCATATFCAVLQGDDSLLTSTNPTGGKVAWTAGSPISLAYLQNLSCGSVTLCATYDDQGNVLASSTPTVSSSWHLIAVDPGNTLNGILCVGASFCVATDGFGNIMSSTSPTTAWTAANPLSSLGGVYSVACRSATSCLAASGGGLVVTSTPADPNSWLPVDPGLPYTPVVGCGPSTCAAASGDGQAVITPDLGATWSAPAAAGSLLPHTVGTLACLSATSCLAFDEAGQLSTSSDGGATWGAPAPSGQDSASHLRCPAANACIAVTGYGNLVSTSITPLVAASWTPGVTVGTGSTADVSCPTVTLCVAADSTGTISYSTNAFDASPTWTDAATVGSGLGQIACPTVSLCVATDAYTGAVYGSTTPTSGAAWTTTAPVGTGPISLSCPSTSLCVAGSYSGILATTTPATGGWTVVDPTKTPDHIACPTVTVCLGTSGDGVFASTTPSVAGSWGAPVTEGQTSDLTCRSATLCLLGGLDGRVRRTTDPAASIGRHTTSLAVDEAGHVAWVGSGSFDGCSSDVVRVTTSSVATLSRTPMDGCFYSGVAVSAGRTFYNTDTGLWRAPAGGGTPTLVAPRDSQRTLASDGSTVYFARQDTVAADGIYALADAATTAAKLPAIGGPEPTAARVVDVSPGRVAYVDDAVGAGNPALDNPWGTWNRSLTNAADGLTAGTPSLVSPASSGLTMAISGKRTAFVDPVLPVLKVKTGTAAPVTVDSGTGSDFFELSLSGGRALYGKGGMFGENYSWVLNDLNSRTTRVVAAQGVWKHAVLWGRYIAAIKPNGEVDVVDVRTNVKTVVAAAPSVSAGQQLGALAISAAGGGVTFFTEVQDGNGSQISAVFKYLAHPGALLQSLPLVGDQIPAFAMSRQYVAYPTGDGLHLAGQPLPSGSPVATQAQFIDPYGSTRYALYQTPLDLDRNVLGYRGADGFAHVEQLPAVSDPPVLLSGVTLGSFTLGGGRTWAFDQVTSAPLTSCSVTIKNAATLVRTLPCSTADMAVGEATAAWDGKNASGVVVPVGTYTWTLSAANADGALLNDNLSAAPVTGTVVVAVQAKLSKVTPPSSTTGYFTALFDHDIYAGSSANVRLLPPTGTTSLTATRTCLSSTGAAASCAGPFRTMRLKPASTLVPGAGYRVQVNPTGAATLVDAGRAPVVSVLKTGLRSLTADDLTFSEAWGSVSSSSAIGGRYSKESRAGATFSTTFTGTGVRYWYVKGPDGGRVKVAIDGVTKTTALDQYQSTRGYRKYVTYAGLTNAKHTISVTVNAAVTSTRRVGMVDAISTATATCTTTTGCTTNPSGFRWSTVAITGGRAAVSDVLGAVASRTFVGTGFNLYRLLGPTQGQYVLTVDGHSVTLNSYATSTSLSAYIRTGLTNGTHTVAVRVLHQTGKTGTSAYAVTVDRLVAR